MTESQPTTRTLNSQFNRDVRELIAKIAHDIPETETERERVNNLKRRLDAAQSAYEAGPFFGKHIRVPLDLAWSPQPYRYWWAARQPLVYVVRWDGVPVYIGSTVQGIRERLRAHRRAESHLADMVRRHPEGSWEIELIFRFSGFSARWREFEMIKRYKPLCNRHQKVYHTSDVEGPRATQGAIFAMAMRRRFHLEKLAVVSDDLAEYNE